MALSVDTLEKLGLRFDPFAIDSYSPALVVETPTVRAVVEAASYKTLNSVDVAVVSGVDGAGKTTALRYAEQVAKSKEFEVLFFDAASMPTPKSNFGDYIQAALYKAACSDSTQLDNLSGADIGEALQKQYPDNNMTILIDNVNATGFELPALEQYFLRSYKQQQLSERISREYTQKLNVVLGMVTNLDVERLLACQSSQIKWDHHPLRWSGELMEEMVLKRAKYASCAPNNSYDISKLVEKGVIPELTYYSNLNPKMVLATLEGAVSAAGGPVTLNSCREFIASKSKSPILKDPAYMSMPQPQGFSSDVVPVSDRDII